MSTSLVDLFGIHSGGPRPTGSSQLLTDSPLKGFLASFIGVKEEHVDIYDACDSPGQRTEEADVDPVLKAHRLFGRLKRRPAKRNKQSCGWHLCVCFQFNEL